MKRMLLLSGLLLLCLAAASSAMIPRYINYQGVLTDGAGVAVPDGNYNVHFRIYDVASGGSPLWEELRTVQVSKGIFSIVLGKVTPIDLEFFEGYWLAMQVMANPELTPRVELATVPYAMTAGAVHGANLFAETGDVGIGTTVPVEALDVDGAIRLGTTANTNAGTIRWTGTDFEGYDGATWHSLTATGGASLPPGSTGQTLRHNGSAWVSSSNLYNNGTAVGIGTQTPSTELTVYGDGDVVSIDGPAGGQGSLRFMTEGNPKWAWYMPLGGDDLALWHYRLPYIDNFLYCDASKGYVGIRQEEPETMLDVAGSIHADDSLLATNLVLDSPDNLSIMARQNGLAQLYLSTNSHGSNLDLFDDEGNYMIGMDADVSGEGGFFYVRRGVGLSGFMVDGNYAGTNNPRVSINGTASSMYFYTDQTGNGSVMLPSGSIYRTEILDEPGAASYTEGATSVLLGSSPTTLATQSIACPTTGYVLAIGTCQGRASHATGTASSAQFGVSTSATLPANQDVGLYLHGGNPSGTYDLPVTVHGLFEVTAGAHNFYLLGESMSGTHYAFDRQLTLVFLPTGYGTIEPTIAGPNVPDDEAPAKNISAAGAAAIHDASIAANVARLERELAEMRERFAEMEREMENNGR